MTGLRLAVCLLLPIGCAACDTLDQSGADDVWRPKGINAANLAAMVQDPADLVSGHGDGGPDRKLSAKAVNDMWSKPAASSARDGGSAGGDTPSAMSPAVGGTGGSGFGGSGSGAAGSGGSAASASGGSGS